ncbi:unnamed protein product, partial [Phaeothamnion confervicola]
MTIAFHKPYGVMTGFTDPHAEQAGPRRPTLADYLERSGMAPVGRLDLDSEGLLLLTDEPRVSARLTAPGRHSKTYWVELERIPDEAALRKFREGVILQKERTRPAEIRLIENPNLGPRPVPVRERKNVPTCWAEVVLWEGKNRQVRRMTAAVGHPTLRLLRWAVGPIVLGDLPAG